MNKPVSLNSAIALSNKQKAALSRQMGHRAQHPKPRKVKAVEPTPEQQDRNGFHSAGMAMRKTPVIDTMLTKGQITTAHYIALSYYRDQAIAADNSPIKSNIDFTVRTGGRERPIGHQTPQQTETYRIEADLGNLQSIARAIVVDDMSLSQWCLNQYGGKEVLRGRKVTIEPSQKNMKIALLELKYAAGMIVI